MVHIMQIATGLNVLQVPFTLTLPRWKIQISNQNTQNSIDVIFKFVRPKWRAAKCLWQSSELQASNATSPFLDRMMN